MTRTTRQLMIHVDDADLESFDQGAKRRGLTRSGYFTYIARAEKNHLIFFADPSTVDYWKGVFLEEVRQVARVVGREEAKLYLHEQGFTTAPYEE